MSTLIAALLISSTLATASFADGGPEYVSDEVVEDMVDASYAVGEPNLEACVRLLHVARFAGAFESDTPADQSFISADNVEKFAAWIDGIKADGHSEFSKRCIASLRKFTK